MLAAIKVADFSDFGINHMSYVAPISSSEIVPPLFKFLSKFLLFKTSLLRFALLQDEPAFGDFTARVHRFLKLWKFAIHVRFLFQSWSYRTD